ncbi:hypothetical protein [Bacillus sp. FJAT-27445]|uniref:hypothetical protein n=1 Tax=Bacillus sp. FJAT-27445 TaxID=1679166 RepID=UPI0007440267|nr:hypothetical protein [Bacillus sp. FJAT-27445]
MGKKKKKKNKNKNRKTYYYDDWGIDSDETFAFIAGYTSGGAPYGITHEEMAEIELLEREAELRKKALKDSSLEWVDKLLGSADLDGDDIFDDGFGYLHVEDEAIWEDKELQREKEQHRLKESAERLTSVKTLRDEDAPYLLENDASFFFVKC